LKQGGSQTEWRDGKKIQNIRFLVRGGNMPPLRGKKGVEKHATKKKTPEKTALITMAAGKKRGEGSGRSSREGQSP